MEYKDKEASASYHSEFMSTTKYFNIETHTVVVEAIYNSMMSGFSRLEEHEKEKFLSIVKIVNSLPLYQFFSKDRVEDYAEVDSPINLQYKDVFFDAYLTTRMVILLKGIDVNIIKSIVNITFFPLTQCDLGNVSDQVYSLSEIKNLGELLSKKPWLALAFCFFSLGIVSEFIYDVEQLNSKGE